MPFVFVLGDDGLDRTPTKMHIPRRKKYRHQTGRFQGITTYCRIPITARHETRIYCSKVCYTHDLIYLHSLSLPRTSRQCDPAPPPCVHSKAGPQVKTSRQQRLFNARRIISFVDSGTKTLPRPARPLLVRIQETLGNVHPISKEMRRSKKHNDVTPPNQLLDKR